MHNANSKAPVFLLLYFPPYHLTHSGGQEDRLAIPSEVQRLAKEGLLNIPSGPRVHIFENCGHNVVFESPKAWRDAVLKFLS